MLLSDQLIKKLKGHGNGIVKLMRQGDFHYVSKSGNDVGKSADLLTFLGKNGFNVPKIYERTDNYIEMEYIDGVDMQMFISRAAPEQLDHLYQFICLYTTFGLDYSTNKDLTEHIEEKISNIATLDSFKKTCVDPKQLLDDLPTVVPTALDYIHGDFTFDNMIYAHNKFYLIDANPTKINSVWYDVNKLRQDIDCLWFVRNDTNQTNYRVVCNDLSQRLKKRWTFLQNDSILIFMLMRILPYCTENQTEVFLIREINKLCKS